MAEEKHTHRPFKISCATLDRHAASNLRHWDEQRKGFVGASDSLVGNANSLGLDHGVGKHGARREVKVGEDDLVLSNEIVFWLKWLFHFDNHIALPVHLTSRFKDLAAGLDVKIVAKATTFACASLDNNRVPTLDQLLFHQITHF